MTMKKMMMMLAALAVVGTAGCTITPAAPPAGVTPTFAPAPVVESAQPESEPQAPAEPVSAPVDEEAFFDAIASGFVIRDLPRMPIPEAEPLRAATLDAGYSMCPVLMMEGGYEQAMISAEQALADRSTFTGAMPGMFVNAARDHLCGGAR